MLCLPLLAGHLVTPYPFPHAFDRSRYSDHYLLSHLSEAAVQAQIVDALGKMGLLAWVVDVGGKKVRGRACAALRHAGVDKPAQLLRAKHPGASDAPQGFPDVPGLIPPERSATGHLIPFFLEVKRPMWLKLSKTGRLTVDQAAGEPTEEQLGFLLSVHHAGACCGVVWSVSDAVEILKKWLRVASR
ncbi:MAG TPA: hypothetical protein VN436_17865 [Holophaga sp.]|nr:hypothetical protein [Holophaga sp.]